MKIFDFLKTNIEDDEQENLRISILNVNIRRGRVLAKVVICLDIFFAATTLFALIFKVNEILDRFNYIYYLGMYLLMISINISFLLYIKRGKDLKNKSLSQLRNLEIGFITYVTLISSWTSMVSLMDQKLYGQLMVFMVNTIIISVLFVIDNKKILIPYGCSVLIMYIGLPFFQSSKDILFGHYINLSVFIITSWLASRFIYLNYCGDFKSKELLKKTNILLEKEIDQNILINKRLEDLVKERTDALIKKQQEVNRLQQFNLIGEMAASIAHEIRNPLTSVHGFLQLLGAKDYNQKDKDYFELMTKELDRANSILTDFLSLSKNKEIAFKKENLNSIISNLIPLLKVNILSNQTLKVDLGEITELLLDEKKICQVILNLTKNGFEAMPSGGCLTIKTYQLNDEIILEIQDKGEGIEPEVLDKISAPFYTTKEKGTGLGLTVSHNIIKQHNGKLEIESSSKGSNFLVFFKAVS
ncbi:MAG: ATP-binding protein [Desulfitobacteriaceae bacterium]